MADPLLPTTRPANDKEFRRAQSDWHTYVETLTHKVIAIDPTIPELPVKDVVMRIYRDIRFSHDPTPYRPFFSAAFSRTGRKGPYACYYVHCEPGATFLGGGLWMPDAAALAKLRASIDRHPARWRTALADEGLRKAFFGRVNKGDVDGCVKAFCKANKESALKTKPRVSARHILFWDGSRGTNCAMSRTTTIIWHGDGGARVQLGTGITLRQPLTI